MCDISVNNGTTESMISGFISRVQEHIIDESGRSRDTIINAINRSAGSFIESLKVEVGQEAVIMEAIGELLIEMAEHIRSAAATLADVDAAYNDSKV